MPPFDLKDDDNDDVCSHASLGTEVNGTRFEDVCRARDDADRLREELCRLRERLEGVEEERNFHAAKANELMCLLKIDKNDSVNQELVKKTLQVAGLNTQVERLHNEKEAMVQANARFKKEIQDLSAVVRSLQNTMKLSEEEESDDEEDEIELTAEKALDMTLGNMKAHIEVLEDALQTRTAQCKDQKKKIKSLQRDNEMNITKVEMLEALFRELNQDRSDEEIRKEQETQATLAIASTPSQRPTIIKQRSLPSLDLGEKMRSFRAARAKQQEKPTPTASRQPMQPSKMSKIKICFKKAGLEGTYTGPVKDGMPHGVGSIRFTNGDTYLGEMKSGKMSGKGTLFSKSRGVMRGQFENNQFLA
jgi:hypothetical protein